jgi:TonB-dependent starch-binding outer membrane protein SusC
MQEFATRKAIAQGLDLRQLNCLFRKYRMAVRIMKLTTILLTVACLQLSAKGITQTVTISVKDAPLYTVLKAIQKQTDFRFIISNRQLQKAKPVSITATNMPLQQVLELCFKDQPLTYKIIEKVISVMVKEGKEDNTGITAPLPENIDVKGRVVNEQNEPVQNVSVAVKGTTNGTTTNSNGDFLLRAVNENATLVFTSVNMETFEVKVNKRTFLDVALQTKITSMQEVVINKGYYTESRRFSTGNVGKVTAKEIERQPINNPLLALQGRVPGVTVTQTSGLPGAGVVVRIQGQNSLQNGSNPLYIVDGVPISTEIPSAGPGFSPLPNSGETYIRQTFTGKGSTLTYLNPSDIESIEILKDADATAIYGSRAANGAVLITTKKGKTGKATLNVDVQHGFGEVPHFMELLNTDQYIEMRKEALKNDNRIASNNTAASSPFIYAPDLTIWDTTRYTNWQKELIGGTAKYTHANASISGGSSEVQYIFGGSYHKETTVYPGDFANQRGSMHININNNNDLKNKFHFQVSSSYSADKNNLPAVDLTGISVKLVPNAPALYNDDGSLNWQLNSSNASTFVNPLAALFYQTYVSKTNNLIANGNLSYDVLPGLRISTSLGFTNLTSNDAQKNSLLAQRPEDRPFYTRDAFFGDSKLNTWSIEPQLSYKRQLGKGRFDGLMGSSFQRTFKEAGYIYASGFNNDQVMSAPSAATSLISNSYFKSLYKYNAVFSRLNYTYNDKYILNVTGRRDGSTRFGGNNKFHNFWSVGAGWIFSQENLLGNKSLLSFGKLKGSYGTTGSDQIGDYRFLTLYNNQNPQTPYQNNSVLIPGDVPNPYLQWEETKKINLGLDIGLINDRIFITANYSRNRSSNQLLSNLLPTITGRSSVLSNFNATVENTNWEFSLSTLNLKTKDINWTTNINLTIPRNKLIAFPNLEGSLYSANYIVGKPINLSKLPHSGGIDPTSGLYRLADRHGNPTNTLSYPDDYTYLFTDFAKFYGGFQNAIQYKGLQLDILFQFVKKMAAVPDFGVGYAPGRFFGFASTGNQPVSVLDRWQKPGDKTSIQRFTAVSGPASDAFLDNVGGEKIYGDASYIRLKNVSLYWNLPSNWLQKIHLLNCRLFAQAQNLLTITNYKGLDPEVPGFITLPPLRVITFGLQVKL